MDLGPPGPFTIRPPRGLLRGSGGHTQCGSTLPMPSFCRHNRLVQNCPICSKEQDVEPRPLISPSLPRGGLTQPHSATPRPRSGGRSAASRSASKGSRSAAGRGGSSAIRVRRLRSAVDDGYRSPLVPGLKSSEEAERLALELALAAGRLQALSDDPPGLYGDLAAPTGDPEERTWLGFLIAYLGPLETVEDPFAAISAVRTSWASGELPVLDALQSGPRSAHDPGRGDSTMRAYRAWAERAGSQSAAYLGDASWSAERRFARVFERLALPGLPRAARSTTCNARPRADRRRKSLMRRLLLLLSLIALPPAAVALAVGTGSAVASRQATSAASAPKRHGVTITSSRNPSGAGRPIVISGRVSGAAPRPVTVWLWVRYPGDRRFHFSLSTRSDSSGHYAITLGSGQVTTNREWYVTAGGARSPILRQSVRSLIGLSSSDKLPVPGERLVLHGHVYPWHGGSLILLQRLGPQGWQTISRSTAGA